ncbi:TlpA disulfide reductase family protein [Pedobacter sp. MC2016-05]|uniref:TlpA family protein disulfide reductase n=1 Tax=Pedobacter sp. MC2016-05 TaxID=2994474 RepID=UPI0022472358|nr:TlpA disulfide reductase family protein [Pedobacter sp. MC2016-05]MCX2476433.1 TlpA disulfide reductase family protein [Pedobacter sp. MC2016-05]
MKKIFLLLSLAFSINTFAQTSDEGSYTKVGDTAPTFTFEIEKGKIVDLADFKGKLILINLFATWCPPCNTELPLVQKQIWDKHKNDKNFQFFVFGREEGWDKLIPYKTKRGFTFPILPDVDRSIFSKFAKQSIPRNILIDQNGKIIYQSIGYEEKEFQSLVKLIDDKLNAAANTK